jgi:hypothetical protein
MPDVTRHLSASHKLSTDGLDWELAGRHGLTESEKDALQYFADVESYTVYYMMEIATSGATLSKDMLSFLAVWNYEEMFHGRAMRQLLDACGVPAPAERTLSARTRARRFLEDKVERTLGRLAPETFVTLWHAWGAVSELLTTHGYEELARTTANPVLAELCRRIARQERRHFAWYYEASRERLAASPFARRVIRMIFEAAWAPVGGTVKSRDEQAAAIKNLYDGTRFAEILAHVDHRMSQLPGMEDFTVCARWGERVLGLPRFKGEPTELASSLA